MSRDIKGFGPNPTSIEPSTNRKVIDIPTVVKALLLTTVVVYSMVSTLLWVVVLKTNTLAEIFDVMSRLL